MRVVADFAKENIAAREKKVETNVVAALPKIAKLVWKAPKLFMVRTESVVPVALAAWCSVQRSRIRTIGTELCTICHGTHLVLYDIARIS